MREGRPGLRPEVRWQLASAGLGTTIQDLPRHPDRVDSRRRPTGRTIEFETVDVPRVVDGRVTDHRGIGNLLTMRVRLGALTLDA